MKDIYSKHNADYAWIIKAEGWVRSLQGIREAQLSLGNGFLGTRGVLEEIPYDAKPGTYLAGVYDNVGSRVDELVNLPNPFNFKITANGEKLGVITMDLEKHERTLNMREGLLTRHSIFLDTDKKRYDYQSIRFVSMHNKNLGVMQIALTSLDSDADISIETGIDTSVYNAGTATEGRKKHFRVKELGQFKNEGFLVLTTFNKSHTVIFRSGFYHETLGKKVKAKDNIFSMPIRKNQTVVFTKIFYVDFTSNEKCIDDLKERSEKGFREVFQKDFNTLLRKHAESWKKVWSVAEVSIWGAPEVEKNFRFNIYHMLICARANNGFSSIGAKALTGEGYRGHIFWDAEIFLFPFYLYIFPDIAKNMLLYRYKRLDKAREISMKNGYEGAMFPWESAGSGAEETPDRAKDLDGKIIKIHTGSREHHITADIAFAYYQYYNATEDEEFLNKYGYEVLFETARFWASRAEWNKKKKKYEIKNVIGPDEFHEDVNNNAYTNMMAKWNLLIAHRMFQKIKKDAPKAYKKITEKIDLSQKEPAEWKNIAGKIVFRQGKNGVIEQFDGYFRKTKIKIKSWDENYIPIIPKKLTPRDYKKTQLVKQGDVALLLYLLPLLFSSKAVKKNYEYYVERTIHKSSLSLPIYSILAARSDDKNRAYRFFETALLTDVSNVHRNTFDGVHAACIGGVWQALINGFAGLRIEKGMLSLDPKLPGTFRKILFSINWRGRTLKFEVNSGKVEVEVVSSGKEKMKEGRIKVFGNVHKILANKKTVFKRKSAVEKEAYYL